MNSFLQGKDTKSHTFLGMKSPFHRCSYAESFAPMLDDPAVSPEHHYWMLSVQPIQNSYVLQLEAEITELRAQLAAKQRELAAALALDRDEDRTFDFPIEIERTYPARIVEEIDLPFLFAGGEAEE